MKIRSVPLFDVLSSVQIYTVLCNTLCKRLLQNVSGCVSALQRLNYEFPDPIPSQDSGLFYQSERKLNTTLLTVPSWNNKLQDVKNYACRERKRGRQTNQIKDYRIKGFRETVSIVLWKYSLM